MKKYFFDERGVRRIVRAVRDYERRPKGTPKKERRFRPIRGGGGANFYELSLCADPTLRAVVADQDGTLADNVGKVVVATVGDYRDSFPECWKIEKQSPCKGGDCLGEILEIRENCESCSPCFELVNCDNPGDIIEVNDYLWYAYLDRVVELFSEGGLCRLVRQKAGDGCTNPQTPTVA